MESYAALTDNTQPCGSYKTHKSICGCARELKPSMTDSKTTKHYSTTWCAARDEDTRAAHHLKCAATSLCAAPRLLTAPRLVLHGQLPIANAPGKQLETATSRRASLNVLSDRSRHKRSNRQTKHTHEQRACPVQTDDQGVARSHHARDWAACM
jgi:hypothetical protein